MAVFVKVAQLTKINVNAGTETFAANIDNRTTSVQASKIKLSQQGTGGGKTVLTVVDVNAAANDISTTILSITGTAGTRYEVEFRFPSQHMAATIDRNIYSLPSNIQDGDMFQDSDLTGIP